MSLPTPIHIPKGHELVKRYGPIYRFDTGGWDFDDSMIKETAEGEYVRIEDVKAHLIGWLEDEIAKLPQALEKRDDYDRGCEHTAEAVIHHLKILL